MSLNNITLLIALTEVLGHHHVERQGKYNLISFFQPLRKRTIYLITFELDDFNSNICFLPRYVSSIKSFRLV